MKNLLFNCQALVIQTNQFIISKESVETGDTLMKYTTLATPTKLKYLI